MDTLDSVDIVDIRESVEDLAAMINDIHDLLVIAENARSTLDDVCMAMPQCVRRDEIQGVADRLASALKRFVVV